MAKESENWLSLMSRIFWEFEVKVIYTDSLKLWTTHELMPCLSASGSLAAMKVMVIALSSSETSYNLSHQLCFSKPSVCFDLVSV